MRRGQWVAMSEEFKSALRANDCGQHVDEFGGCTGVVEDEVDFGCGSHGPEVNVRWIPSGLRYGYHPDQLVARGPVEWQVDWDAVTCVVRVSQVGALIGEVHRLRDKVDELQGRGTALVNDLQARANRVAVLEASLQQSYAIAEALVMRNTQVADLEKRLRDADAANAKLLADADRLWKSDSLGTGETRVDPGSAGGDEDLAPMSPRSIHELLVGAGFMHVSRAEIESWTAVEKLEVEDYIAALARGNTPCVPIRLRSWEEQAASRSTADEVPA